MYKGDSDSRLYLEIMKSAVEDDDLEYFLGETFRHHCTIIGVDSEVVVNSILRQKLITPREKSVYIKSNRPQMRVDMRRKREEENKTVEAIAQEYDISSKTVFKILKEE